MIHCASAKLQGVLKIAPKSGPQIAYASFDRFPSPKGAATHIDAFTTAIARRFGGLRLFTVAPAEEELRVLRETHQQHLEHFQNHPEEARRLVNQGESPLLRVADAPVLAAWTLVANLTLNLDEFMTMN